MRLAHRPATVLIVGANAAHRRAVKGAIDGIVDVAEVASAEDALGALGASPSDGLVTMPSLGDTALESLSVNLMARSAIHWLVLAEQVDGAFLRRMVDVGAQCLPWPTESECLAAFAKRISAARQSDLLVAFDQLIQALAREHSLTGPEVALIAAALRGMSGKEYVLENCLSPNTYKMRARSALRKLGACSLGEVRDGLLRSLRPVIKS
jgi:DNA-binding NarL/FixJ family response regulator